LATIAESMMPRQKNDRPKPVNLSDHFLIH